MMDKDTVRADGLNPSLDPDRWDRLVGRIMLGADEELARRRSAFTRVQTWATPIVAAAASVAALAAGALLSTGSVGADIPTLAEAVLPTEVVTFLDYGEAPTVEALFTTLDAEGDAR